MGLFSSTFGGTMAGRGSQSLADSLYSSPKGFTPDSPGALIHDRTVPVIQDVRPFSPPEAEALKVEAQQAKTMAAATKAAYSAIEAIEAADQVRHEAHYSYRGKVAEVNLAVKQAHGKYATTLEELRSGYAEVGRNHFQAAQEADVKVLAAKAAVDQLLRGHGGLTRQREGALLR